MSQPVVRPSGRAPSEMRSITFERSFTCHAEGSVLVSFGNTKVICTASVGAGVPGFLRGKGEGWLTAEYGMLPRSTGSRMDREAARGKQTGRTVEIQRLIGRSLRAALDLRLLGERTLTVDCDVIQADGGTRTASITGAWVALADALDHLYQQGLIDVPVPLHQIASVSVGLQQGEVLLDLDYSEDSTADTDMNFVMNDEKRFIEIQGTAEHSPFSEAEMQKMTAVAVKGIEELMRLQRLARETD